MTKTVLRISVLSFLVFACLATYSQKSGYGAFYQYGAIFNLDDSNKDLWKPQDGSSAGIYYQLDNGVKALGFRAALSARWTDVKWEVNDYVYVIHKNRSVELKLQCTLRTGPKNMFGLGMAPRIVTHSGFALGSKSKGNGTTYEYNRELPGIDANLNELNSALCLSWYHDFNKFVTLGVHADGDMLPFFEEAVAVPIDEAGGLHQVNVRLTSLALSLILNVR